MSLQICLAVEEGFLSYFPFYYCISISHTGPSSLKVLFSWFWEVLLLVVKAVVLWGTSWVQISALPRTSFVTLCNFISLCLSFLSNTGIRLPRFVERIKWISTCKGLWITFGIIKALTNNGCYCMLRYIWYLWWLRSGHIYEFMDHP